VDATAPPSKDFVGILLKAVWMLKRHARAAKDHFLRATQSSPASQLQDGTIKNALESIAPPSSSSRRRGALKDVVQSEIERLKTRLHNLSLEMVVVAGDGNCQFRSCSHQLYGTDVHHEYLRKRAVEYMREHASEFQVTRRKFYYSITSTVY